jgi:hypothetical protein
MREKSGIVNIWVQTCAWYIGNLKSNESVTEQIGLVDAVIYPAFIVLSVPSSSCIEFQARKLGNVCIT